MNEVPPTLTNPGTRIQIGTQGNMIVVQFDFPIGSISFNPKEARQFAEAVRQASYKCQEKP